MGRLKDSLSNPRYIGAVIVTGFLVIMMITSFPDHQNSGRLHRRSVLNPQTAKEVLNALPQVLQATKESQNSRAEEETEQQSILQESGMVSAIQRAIRLSVARNFPSAAVVTSHRYNWCLNDPVMPVGSCQPFTMVKTDQIKGNEWHASHLSANPTPLAIGALHEDDICGKDNHDVTKNIFLQVNNCYGPQSTCAYLLDTSTGTLRVVTSNYQRNLLQACEESPVDCDVQTQVIDGVEISTLAQAEWLVFPKIHEAGGKPSLLVMTVFSIKEEVEKALSSLTRILGCDEASFGLIEVQPFPLSDVRLEIDELRASLMTAGLGHAFIVEEPSTGAVNPYTVLAFPPDLSNFFAGPQSDEFNVLAIIAGFNEHDILEQSLNKLLEQQINVHYIDSWSQDDTTSVLQKMSREFQAAGLKFTFEEYPSDRPSNTFALSELMRRKEDIAAQTKADWIIHMDVDEIWESPWEGFSLKAAIEAVDQFGYNAINVERAEFCPTDESFAPGMDHEEHFKYFSFLDDPSTYQLRVRAWARQKSDGVNLASTGGMNCQFQGQKVFPVNFIVKHYPIRSTAHAMKKIFTERIPRVSLQERDDLTWHKHYDSITRETNFVCDPKGREHSNALHEAFQYRAVMVARKTEPHSTPSVAFTPQVMPLLEFQICAPDLSTNPEGILLVLDQLYDGLRLANLNGWRVLIPHIITQPLGEEPLDALLDTTYFSNRLTAVSALTTKNGLSSYPVAEVTLQKGETLKEIVRDARKLFAEQEVIVDVRNCLQDVHKVDWAIHTPFSMWLRQQLVASTRHPVVYQQLAIKILSYGGFRQGFAAVDIGDADPENLGVPLAHWKAPLAEFENVFITTTTHGEWKPMKPYTEAVWKAARVNKLTLTDIAKKASIDISHLTPVQRLIVEKLICQSADIFVGRIDSRFSFHVKERRYVSGMESFYFDIPNHNSCTLKDYSVCGPEQDRWFHE